MNFLKLCKVCYRGKRPEGELLKSILISPMKYQILVYFKYFTKLFICIRGLEDHCYYFVKLIRNVNKQCQL